MIFSRIALLNVLLLLPSFGVGWDDFREDYVPYPPEATGALDYTVSKIKDVPSVRVLGTLPGSHLFEAIQEVAVRNNYQNPLFKLDVAFLMEDGVKYGCRHPTKDATLLDSGRYSDTFHGKQKHTPNFCHSHCTHAGRYCPVFPPEELKETTDHSGGDLVMEVLRRLCIGDKLEGGFANPIWFRYLEAFEKRNCMEKRDGMNLARCSGEIFKEDIPDFPSKLAYEGCVRAEEQFHDFKNKILEHSLDVSYSQNYTAEEMPLIDIAVSNFSPAISISGISSAV